MQVVMAIYCLHPNVMASINPFKQILNTKHYSNISLKIHAACTLFCHPNMIIQCIQCMYLYVNIMCTKHIAVLNKS